ncbi:MAG TPA: bifunctional oligoribonuclease/PAP phosphatase NrnA [Armatimonadota bacterium]|nr:bifunctional oligoribonuclease/PAP phosphatase NrnA [Armatimonadota bacterium]
MTAIGDAGRVARAIEAASIIHLAAHENPDGDAVGALLGLRLALLATGRQVRAATPTPPPRRYRFLPGFETIEGALPSDPADLAIALDCDGITRLGDLQAAFIAARVTADVDHHRPETAFGDVRFVDPDHPATATMVLDVLHELRIPLTPEIAACLYTGLITDTGNFRFANTDPEALRAGAELIEAGADPSDLARRCFSLRPLGVIMLEGRALTSLRGSESGLIVFSILTLADFAATGTSPDDTDGIIDSFRDAIGIEVAVLIKEVEPGSWNVSLRSHGLDVASIAAQFGGGGHRVAAGCTVAGTAEEVAARLEQMLEHALARAPTPAGGGAGPCLTAC